LHPKYYDVIFLNSVVTFTNLHRIYYAMQNQVNIKVLLSDLFSGFSFRSKVENEPNGDLFVIQMKDLEHHYSSIKSELTKISSDKISSRFSLEKGDILFIAKGSNNYAIEYKLNLPKAIAASAFFVLRPNQLKVIPSYLAWYINQQPVQQYLKENMAGTYIPNINKSTIEGISISLPSVDIQNKIVALDNLKKIEHLLMNEIMAKRETVISNSLLQLVRN
jgi:restriction endonuclease S subunit